MMTTLTLFLWGWLASASLMLVLWVIQLFRHNAGTVDVAWAFATASLGIGFCHRLRRGRSGTPHAGPAETAIVMDCMERGLVPDRLIRKSIRHLLKQRLAELRMPSGKPRATRERQFIAMMDNSSIAPIPHKANQQHYELPAVFFNYVLGKHRKYSCCYWGDRTIRLNEAEETALRITCERAGLENHMRVLDLGCGWGSLSLWIAERYPESRVTGVSNSHSQREFIMAEAKRRELSNVDIITADMNTFTTERRFDRVVSVEMFEHMRNYRTLFRRITGWLEAEGRFFMHIFCHCSTPYEFIDEGPGDWMSRHFFAGGMMPSDTLPERFQEQLTLIEKWRWNGCHYAKTAEAWFQRMEQNKPETRSILKAIYGEKDAPRWWIRWRIFFMACAELFGYNQGQKWWVSHYLFERPGRH
ncbi:MAG: class I SAM-dependent methyltransferase [Gammaproteobacteria bacterium]